MDEINTNDNVNGILKEVLIDRRLLGRPLPEYVVPVAAGNPYKLRKEKGDALTKGLKFDDLKSSKLVYLVNPLPESMVPFVWNFGSLPEKDEARYIERIVHRAANEWQELHSINKSMTRALQRAQLFVREQ